MPFLQDFAKHLKAKNWFKKTTIAMDERPMKAMMQSISIIKKADEYFRVSLARTYHRELSADLVDYSITLAEDMPDEVLNARKGLGF